MRSGFFDQLSADMFGNEFKHQYTASCSPDLLLDIVGIGGVFVAEAAADLNGGVDIVNNIYLAENDNAFVDDCTVLHGIFLAEIRTAYKVKIVEQEEISSHGSYLRF